MFEALIFLIVFAIAVAIVLWLLSWALSLIPRLPVEVRNLILAGVILLALLYLLRHFAVL